MTRLVWAIVLGGSLLPLGCRKTEERAASPPAVPSPAPTPAPSAPAVEPRDAAAPAEPPFVSFAGLVGQCVEAEGTLEGGPKTGVSLAGGAWSVGVIPASDAALRSTPGGARVRVRGVVAVRADRPVFIPKKGEPIMQGIPMPEGTDLEQARRRHVIDQAVISVLRTPAEVEAALVASVGKDVRLAGVVWSVNGHYWFNHDGVELHVEGQESFPEWTSLHGKPVTLRGRLSRRPMPRIDQLVLKPKPDLKDAFVLSLRELAPPPQSPVTPCGE